MSHEDDLDALAEALELQLAFTEDGFANLADVLADIIEEDRARLAHKEALLATKADLLAKMTWDASSALCDGGPSPSRAATEKLLAS
jgi:hypothetical protein